MPVEVTSSSRKRRRKEERQKKKQKRGQQTHTEDDDENTGNKNDTAAAVAVMDPLSKTTTKKKKTKKSRNDNDNHDATTTKRQKKKKRHDTTTINNNNDKYSKFDSSTAAALRADDEEIAALEAKLGLDKKGKNKLNKEYAKLEGYGDDFGNFLDDLDDLVDRVVDGEENEEDYEGMMDGFDDDDEEEDLSEMIVDEDGNELVPMKPGADDDDEVGDIPINDINEDDDDDSNGVESDNDSLSSSSDDIPDNEDDDIDNTIHNDNKKRSTADNDDSDNDDSDSDASSSSSSSSSDSDTAAAAAISENDIYRPTSGEDIYGNQITNDKPSPPVAKYTPPHARLSSSSSSSSPDLSILQKNIYSQFNRLSDNNLEPISKSIASLYSHSSDDEQQQQYAANDVNRCIFQCAKKSLIRSDIIVDKLIPLYSAVIASVAKSDLVGYVLERCVSEFMEDARTKRREEEEMKEEEEEEVSKEGLNYLLIVCYLYNYDVVYCGLLYDIIRYLYSDDKNSSSSELLSEHDVEALLLIIQHCGFRLRKDDPSSLKDIVMAVQEKAAVAMATTTTTNKSDSSSRFQYMIDTMTSLKHNKKTIKDKDQEERVMRYKKFVRRMMLGGDNGGGANCLRIGLDDIMNVDTKGRWWKVGASWKGNIYRGDDDGDKTKRDTDANDDDDDTTNKPPSSSSSPQQQHSSELLTLAAKNQINGDTRQSLFCIIMSSADVDDAFEKLVRYVRDDKSSERLVIRVVLDCCAKERNYNPFYSHLATRLCEYQKRCKWSLRLAYWDVFKRWSEEEEEEGESDEERRRQQQQREVVNMSKMLVHFVKKGTLTTRGVLKGMDDLKFDARSMPRMGILFLVAFCDGIFDWDGMESRQVGDVLFGAGLSDSDAPRVVKKRKTKKHDKMDDGDGDDGDEALRESLGVFLKLHMEKSPKNAKGTKWSKNFKAAIKACDLNALDMI